MKTDGTQYTKLSDLIDAFRNSANPTIIDRKKLLSNDFSQLEAIAKLILSGHLEVREGERLIRIVKPTCVEMYYHEEPTGEIDREQSDYKICRLKNGSELITDFIVYHRNKLVQKADEKKDDKTCEKDVMKSEKKKDKNKIETFIPGSLHNHQSGIDITFEHERVIDGVPIVVRASALVRGFCKYKTLEDMKEDMKNRDPKTYEVDKRSTYCYNALYDGAFIFGEGLRVQWKDGEEPLNVEIWSNCRQNVHQYEYIFDKEYDSKNEPLKRTTELDHRKWQFRNALYYK